MAPRIYLVAGLLTLADTLCLKPVVPENAVIVPLLGGVNLTCPGCEGAVSWRRGNQTLDGQHSGQLTLQAVSYEGEDTYSCHKGGAAVCSVPLLVKDELETPQISCFLRHPTHNITCDWTPTRELRPHAKVTVIQWDMQGSQAHDCWYLRSPGKFLCSSPHLEENSHTYALSLCVTGRTDSRSSITLRQTVNDLVQPDPPLFVRVQPLEGQRRRLSVSWDPPILWLDTFYRLEYQVQYRVAGSLHVSNGTTQDTHFEIKDALARRRHIVRVRAKEEFSKRWSTWSDEADGTPWSEDEEASSVTPDPIEEYYQFTSNQENQESQNTDEQNAAVCCSVTLQYALLATGVTLALILLLTLGVLLRHSESRLLKLKGGLLQSLFQPAPKLPGTEPSSVALLSAPWSTLLGVTVCDPTERGPD